MPANGKSVPPLFSSSDIGPSSLIVLNASFNDTLPLAVPGNALNDKLRIAIECLMGSIDGCLRHSPSKTNSTAKHALPANANVENNRIQILTNLLHTLTQLPAQISSAASTSSIDSFDAYPLVKDQDPTDTSEVPL